MNEFAPSFGSAAEAAADQRSAFVRRTYIHLAGAVAVFAVVEYLLLISPLAPLMLRFLGTGRLAWLVILGAFMGVSYLAENLANRPSSKGWQYTGLGLYVVAEAVIFLPLIVLAIVKGGPSLISEAGIVTGGLFAGITAVAFTTKKDFSFLGGILKVAGFVAMGLILAGMLFGFDLGLFFVGAMIVFAGVSILYQTSNVIHRFNTEQHVAASLVLFASVALLFWYVLRLLSSRR